MIGTRIDKTDMSKRAECAVWCNRNRARLIDKGEYLEVVAPSIDEAKTQKIAFLKRQRDKLEVSPIDWNGNSFDYDDKARDRLSIARQSIEDGLIDSIVWTTANNTNTEITLDDFKGINASASIRSNALHIAYRQAKQAVIESETVEQVQAIELEVISK